MKNFIKEMELDRVYKYKIPYMITLTGQSGSGKTLLARELSKELQIFLLSNDYIRNYLLYINQITDRKEIERQVLKINSQRILKLMTSHTSFVLDRDFNKEMELYICNKISKMCGYMPIHIRINSNDQENIKRIQERKEVYDQKDSRIIGDNSLYSTSFTEEEYFQIIKSKPRKIPTFPFNYTLSNNDTEEKYKIEVKKVIEEIKVKQRIKRK